MNTSLGEVMKRICLIGLILGLAVMVWPKPDCLAGTLVIELKNGNKFKVSQYWEEEGKIYFYLARTDGIVGLNKESIDSIREVIVQATVKVDEIVKKKRADSGAKTDLALVKEIISEDVSEQELEDYKKVLAFADTYEAAKAKTSGIQKVVSVRYKWQAGEKNFVIEDGELRIKIDGALTTLNDQGMEPLTFRYWNADGIEVAHKPKMPDQFKKEAGTDRLYLVTDTVAVDKRPEKMEISVTRFEQ